MRTIISLLVVSIFLGCGSKPTDRKELTAGSNPAPAANGKDPREELPTAIAEAIRQLENKEYEKFVADFMSPEDKLQMVGKKIEDIAKLVEKNSADMMAQMQAAQKATPTLEDEGEKAVYKNLKVGERNTKFTMVKSGKYWYISGRNSGSERDRPVKEQNP
jgi:hypothetical protein